MLISRLQPLLETLQPEETHAFRAGHRIEEHLVTANLVKGKLLSVS